MLRSTVEDKPNNLGFTLVELIIVVAILAVAAVPLLKSMGMATKTNAKAQSIQNATSLGEKIMEEMKSSSIDELKTKYGTDFTGDVMTITMDGDDGKGINATQGEQFIVTVEIDRSKYKGSSTFDKSGSSTARKINVGSANTLKIPRLEDIDTLSQAVLSKKELNKYDTEALNYFNQKLPDYNPSATPPRVATIASKTIDIEKSNISLPHDGVTVKAKVTYTDGSGNPYVRDLYTGTFVQQERPDGSKKHLDSNIYIFYTVGQVNENGTIKDLRETFNITDSSNVTTFEEYDPTRPNDCHRVYFIRQISTDLTGPNKITFSGTTDAFKFADSGDLTDGRKQYGDVELVTNLTGTLSVDGHIYQEEARTRVYDITVKLSKNGSVVTTLNSTINASDDS